MTLQNKTKFPHRGGGASKSSIACICSLLKREITSENIARAKSTLPLQTPKFRRPELVSGPQKAFTLAEVLITLAIIGIVAALTIPTVVRNYQKTQYKTAAKKALTTLTNVTNLVIMDNGGTMKTGITSYSYPSLSKYYKDLYKKHVSYIKECDTISQCAQIGAWHKYGEWYGYTGAPITSSMGGYYYHAGLVGKDGMFWRIYFHTPDCSYSGDTCGTIWIDTNGAKKPNTVGKDIFTFRILADRVTNSGYYGVSSLGKGTIGDIYKE